MNESRRILLTCTSRQRRRSISKSKDQRDLMMILKKWFSSYEHSIACSTSLGNPGTFLVGKNPEEHQNLQKRKFWKDKQNKKWIIRSQTVYRFLISSTSVVISFWTCKSTSMSRSIFALWDFRVRVFLCEFFSAWVFFCVVFFSISSHSLPSKYKENLTKKENNKT